MYRVKVILKIVVIVIVRKNNFSIKLEIWKFQIKSSPPCLLTDQSLWKTPNLKTDSGT